MFLKTASDFTTATEKLLLCISCELKYCALYLRQRPQIKKEKLVGIYTIPFQQAVSYKIGRLLSKQYQNHPRPDEEKYPYAETSQEQIKPEGYGYIPYAM